MKELKNLLGDSAIYGLGGIFVRATQIFILPLILYYLTPDEFGTLDYFLNIKNILIILYGWGILTAIFKFSDNLNQKDSSPFNGLLIILAISIIALILLYILSFFTEFVRIYWKNFLLIHLISSFGALLTVPMAVFRFFRKPIIYISLNLIYTIILLGSSYLFVIYTRSNYLSVLYGHVIASFVTLIIGFIGAKKHIEFSINFRMIKKMSIFGFSILLNALSFVTLMATSRFFLKSVGGFDDIGILGMAQRISLFVGALLVSPFALAWLPFVKNKAAEKDFTIITNRVFTLFLWVGLFLTLSLELIQKDIFTLIDNKQYLPSLQYVYLFSLSYVLQGLYFIFSAGIFLSGSSKHYSVIGVSSILFNIAAYLIFYQWLSLKIVILITLFSFLFCVILAYYFGNKIIKIKVVQPINILLLITYTILFITVSHINNSFFNAPIFMVLVVKFTFLLLLFGFHMFMERRFTRN